MLQGKFISLKVYIIKEERLKKKRRRKAENHQWIQALQRAEF